MRFYVFLALLAIAALLDAALFLVSLANPGTHPLAPPVAQAAPPAATAAPPTPTATARPPTPTASPTSTPSPTATWTPTATPSATPTATPTATPAPNLLGGKSVSFTPHDRAVRANIRMALDHYSGALTHVVLAPGEVFSFNATLGLYPQRMPWKNVAVKPTAQPAAPDGTPAPEQKVELIQGGGLCDLASRYVMAARPFLPARAFRFVNHVRSNGVHLTGVPTQDTVSIWAVGGGPGEQDLQIINTAAGWLEWIVERDGEKITVTTRLWDSPPPGW